MTMEHNLERLKHAYQVWDAEKGRNTQPWHDIVCDSVRFKSVAEDAPGLRFARNGLSRDDLVAYFSQLEKDWDMIFWNAEHFVVDGNKIAVFGESSFTFKETGKPIEVMCAHLWTFEGDEVCEFIEVFDSAKAAAAAIA